jgi:hypothetical protein
MGSGNGYVSLDALRGLRRLEADVEIEGLGKFRVQALTQEDVGQASRAARLDGGLVDTNIWRQQHVARGLVQPGLAALMSEDEDEALAVVQAMNPAIVNALEAKITALTYQPPSDAYRSFGIGGASNDDSEGTPSGSSSSANA